jgi:hypothetical protein
MLKPDEDGASIIDFMEKEPLHRAHQDGVDPFTLAEQFAPTFHPDTFGR